MSCEFFDLKGKSIILVGNGPSLIDSNKGEQIDTFEEIIRFNRYKIKKHEKDVGTKTTIWSTFGRGELPRDDDQRPSKIIYIHGNRGEPSYQPECIMRIPLSYYYELRDRLQKETVLKENVNRLIPSSGILVISFLLDTFLDNITIAGFDFFGKRYSSQHHYWANLPYKRPKEHDGGWEYKRVLIYKKLGKINFL